MARRRAGKLSARQVAAFKGPGKLGDGGGLWLRVSSAGHRYWVFRYRFRGRNREMGVGGAEVSLKEARTRAAAARRMIRDGVDPLEERRKQRVQTPTFEQCAEQFISAHQAGWRHAKHRAQWVATLRQYAFPTIGAKPVNAIGLDEVLAILTPIWTQKPETASRLRGRIERILDWAKVRGFRDGENPARWRGHLDKVLPKRSQIRAVRHFPALPWRKVPEFMALLRDREGIAARCLEFAILTAARSGEVRGMTWSELDLDAEVWTIPASRMKTRREHRVPLSHRCIELLRELPRLAGSGLVFPGTRPGRPLSDTALSAVLKRMGYPVTVHGFRSAFKDWASESTNFAREVVEEALAHSLGNQVEAAYRRGDLLAKRRRLMEAWATYCEP